MQSEPHILIVDDARDIREPLSTFLRKNGMRISQAESAARARGVLENGSIDLVILDVMMPGEDGLSLCKWIAGRDGPAVILLTAMDDDTDRIVGLELGADDYITKPFNPRELLARVRAVLRRAPPSPQIIQNSIFRFSGWTYDPASRSLSHRDGRSADLTSAEGRLLGVLLDRPRAILTRDQLLDLTASREAKPYDRAIDNQVSRLRRKMEIDPSHPTLLVTEWGGGYALASDVEVSGK